MVVVVEFALGADELGLRAVLAAVDSERGAVVKLIERDSRAVPYIWVAEADDTGGVDDTAYQGASDDTVGDEDAGDGPTGNDGTVSDGTVSDGTVSDGTASDGTASDVVALSAGVTLLDRVGSIALYRVDRPADRGGLLDALAVRDAVVLAAERRGDGWAISVAFADHDRLVGFYTDCAERAIDADVERVVTVGTVGASEAASDLPPAQRDALVLAVREGYFAVPRRTDLTAIGERFGISQQAASTRVRRGANRVLTDVLFDSPDRR